MDKESNNIKNKNNNEQSQLNSSFIIEMSNRSFKLNKKGNEFKSYDKKNLSTINKNRTKQTIIEEKEKEDFIPFYNKKNFNINLDSKINNKLDNNENTSPYFSSLTQTNFMDIRSPKFASRNISLDNFVNKKLLENNVFKSMKNIPLSPSTNILPNDNNSQIISPEKPSPKYSNKINNVRDDYIDFLQKQFEDNLKNNPKLDTNNNKEFLKKFNDLIQDNRLLNKTLNERTNNLSKIVEENLYIKGELEKSILINQKNMQKMSFFVEKIMFLAVCTRGEICTNADPALHSHVDHT
jgi:hypothetical protein